MRIFCTLLLFFCLTGFTSTTEPKADLKVTAQEYFKTYALRSDFDKLMSFYDNNAQLQDIVYGKHLKNKHEIRTFFAWEQDDFKRLAGNTILTVTHQTFEKNTVVTQGVFHQFLYHGKTMGPWLFVIIQEFNQNAKIIKQVDWINYTPREDFLGGENMNNQ